MTGAYRLTARYSVVAVLPGLSRASRQGGPCPSIGRRNSAPETLPWPVWLRFATSWMRPSHRVDLMTREAFYERPERTARRASVAKKRCTTLEDRTPSCLVSAHDRILGTHRLKARLRRMRGLRTDRTASTVIRGHAFVQNVRRGHYELGVEARHERLRVAAAFDELAEAI